ncbi:MAG: HD-GYP domain-containing protein, partial [Anaerolineae bacterium]
MADTIDARDITTYQHSQRVAQYVEMIARQMRVPFDRIDVMVTATRLHDLGKIGMSNEMLYKPGPFTPEERRIFRQHTIIGDDLVAKFPGFEAGRALVRDHHERFDGTGYPSGKKGKEIALGARILAVADAYDAMTSDRPYRKALSHEKAVAEVKANRGTQFDPEVADAFLKALEGRRVPGERTYMIAPSPAPVAGAGSDRGDG